MTTSSPDRTAAAPLVRPLVDLQGRSAWSVLPPLVLGFFMIMIDTTIVNIAVPTLVKSFDASIVAVGWVNSAYLLSFAVLMLMAGRLGDRYGPRTIFIIGLVVFTASSAWCGFSTSIGHLIAARAVQGVGAALMTPQTMAVITRVFPPRQRGAAMGIWGSVAGVATIAGPLLGGFFVEYWSWEWIFFINVPVGVVALIFSVLRLPKLQTTSKYFDFIGVGLSVVGLFCFVFGLQEGENYDWGTITGPITVWTLIGAGLVILGAFVVWQWHLKDRALMPLVLFRRWNFSLANVCGMAIGFGMVGIFFPLSMFLQSILGLSPIHAALVNLPSSLLSGVVAPMAGRLSDKIPGKWVVATGFASLTGAVVWLSQIVAPGINPWHFVPAMLLFGLGTGCVFSPLANLATSGLDARTAGAGAGAFNTNRQIGSVVGSAAIVAMLTSRLAVEIPAAAKTAAKTLPESVRDQFVSQFSSASLSFTSAQPASLPPGLPKELAAQIEAAATTAVHQGYATAMGQTLLMAAAVLVVGFLFAVAMRPTPVSH